MTVNELRPKQKILIFFIIFMLTFSGSIVALGLPRPAQATMPVADAPSLGAYIGMETKTAVTKQVTEVKDKILDRIMKSLTLIGAQALKSLSLKLTQYISSGVMNMMQTGSWGQEAMWETATWEEWGKELSGTVLSEVMSEISIGGPWANYFDICEPSAEFKLNVMAALNPGDLRDSPDRLGGDRTLNARCSWDNVKNNWEGFIEEQVDYFSGQAELASYVTMNVAIRGFEPQQSEIGQFLWAVDLAKSKADELEKLKKEQRVEGEGFKPDGVNVTGTEQQNPPGTSKAIQEENLRKQTNTQQAEQDQALAVITEIPEQIAVTFLKSVVSQQFVTSLFDLIKKGFSRSPAAYNPSQQVFDYQAQTAGQISKMNQIKVSFNQKEIDFLTDFVNCPSINNAIQQNNVNNCVVYKEFADAVREADYGNPLTVQQALETNQIKDLNFIDDTATNDQVDCVGGAYCYSNLVKLRKARIVPIGWEMAAKQAGGNQTIKLSDLMACFVNPYTVGSEDYTKFESRCVIDGKSYMGLVDPDWVLKQPRATCEAVAFGPTLMASGGTDRYEYCADVKTCVDEKEDGTCGHYAYCAAESNTWRLGGTSCIGNYDSCRALTRNDGKKFNYIMNTVDYGGCNSENAGCLPYSLWKTDNTVPESAWSQEYPDEYYKDGNSLVYLNRKVEDSPCSPGAVGCTRVINTFSGYGANLVPNSDFSYQSQGWRSENNSEIFVEIDGINGEVAKIIQGYGFVIMQKDIPVVPKKFERYYMFRAKVNVPSGTSLEMIPLVRQMTNTGVEITAEEVVKTSEDQEILNNPEARSSLIITTNYITDEWSEIMKIVKLEPSAAYLNVKFIVSGPEDVMVDEVLITEVPSPDQGFYYSDYADKAYEYQKLAPDYLQCYDSMNVSNERTVEAIVDAGSDRKWYTPVTTDSIFQSNLDDRFADSAECSKFAQMCSAQEVGCDQFRPLDPGETISGVATNEDTCPAGCAGYETYSQGATRFVSAEFPLYFIPSTAQQCPASQVGCEEFTNLDTLASGGEAREYYSEVRLCLKTDTPATDSRCGTFYSWVGTNVGGYQLQVYNLQMETVTESGIIITRPKLTNLYPSSTTCNETNYNPVTFPECRQLINVGGEISYVILENTIKCSENCQASRRTLQYDSASQCTDRGGEYRDGECIFWLIPEESKTCSASSAGCRQYRGNTANDVQVVLDDTFDASNLWNGGTESTQSMVNGGKSLLLTGTNNLATGELPFIQLRNQPYIVGFWAQAVNNSAEVEVTLGDVTSTVNVVVTADNGVTDFRYYTTEIMSPTENFRNIKIENTTPSVLVYFDTIQVKRLNDVKYLITESWRTPLACDQTLDGQNLPQAQLGCRAYENTKNATVYLKSLRNTCRAEAVGCQAYIDTKNSASPFSEVYNATTYDVCALAKENGDLPPGDDCVEDFYDELMSQLNVTQQAELRNDYNVCIANLDLSEYGGLIRDYIPAQECKKNANDKAYCQSVDGYDWVNGQCVTAENRFTVSADNLIYLVTNDKTKCGSNDLGCTMIGKPVLDIDYQMSTDLEKDNEKLWANQTYKLLPDQISEKLCLSSEVMCEEYMDKTGNKFYFRNPGERVCEYITKPGESAPNWWVPAKELIDWKACKTRQYYKDGFDQLIRSTDLSYHQADDGSYQLGWVGLCTAKNDMCTAFTDPADVSGGSIYGKAYYYLNDDDIKNAPYVSPKKGYLLFNDTSLIDDQGNIEYKWNAGATYQINEEQDNRGVDPISGTEQSDYMFQWLDENSVICSEHSNYSACTKDSLPSDTLPDFLDTLAKCFLGVRTGNWAVDLIYKLLEYSCAFNYFNNVPEASESGVLLNDCTKEKVACYTTMTSPFYNNSNRMIQVTRDRTCSQWYECKGGMTVYDPTTNAESFVCLDMGLCDQVREGGSGSTACGHFLLDESNKSLLTQNQPFDVANYGSRPKGWTNFDYSGYSIANMYPLQYYRSMDIGSTMDKNPQGEFRLIHELEEECSSDEDCKEFNSMARCMNNWCVESVVPTTDVSQSSAPECRAYPEEDAPFPKYAGSPSNPSYNIYENVFTCEASNDDTGYDCGCAYEKVTFGKQSLEKFYPALTDAYLKSDKAGYCQDFPDIQCSCAPPDKDENGNYPVNTATQCDSVDCQSKNATDSEGLGVCLKQDLDITRYEGIDGYCLEYDKGGVPILGLQNRRACLTWYPLTNMIGLSNMHEEPEAGYKFFTKNTAASTNFCVAAKGNNVPDFWTSDYYSDVYEQEYTLKNEYVRSYLLRMSVGGGPKDYVERVQNYLGVEMPANSGSPSDYYKVPFSSSNYPTQLYLKDIAAISIECVGADNNGWCKQNDNYWFTLNPLSGQEQVARADKNTAGALGTLDSLENYSFTDDKYKDWKYYEIVYLQNNANVSESYVLYAPKSTTSEFDLNPKLYIGDDDNNSGRPVRADSSTKDKFIIFLKDKYMGNGKCVDLFSGVEYSCSDNSAGADSSPDLVEIFNGVKLGDGQEIVGDPCTQDSQCFQYGTYNYYTEDGVFESDSQKALCLSEQCFNVMGNSALPGFGCNDPNQDSEGENIWEMTGAYNICVPLSLQEEDDNINNNGDLFELTSSASRDWKSSCSPHNKNDGLENLFNNYFGIRFIFNEEERLVGLWTSFCDNSGGGGRQDLRINFHLTEYCTEVAQVVNDDERDKAKTNIIYQFYNDRNKALRLDGSSDPVVPNTYQLVYGSYSLPMGGSSKNISNGVVPYIPDKYEEDDSKKIAPGGSGANVLLRQTPRNTDLSSYPGKPLACPGGKTFDGYCNQIPFSTGLTTLKKMFAKVYDGIGGEMSISDNKYDISNDVAIVDNPPIVAAAYVPPKSENQRTNSFTGTTYEAKLNDIAVNYSVGDIDVTGTQYLAFINFYAWASDNQMPIAEIALDYGDSSDSAKRFSTGPTWLRNSKVVCQSDPDKPGKVGLCSDASGIMVNDDFVCTSDNDCNDDATCQFDKLGICKVDNKDIPGFACRSNADCQQGGLSPDAVCSVDTDLEQYARFGDAPNACRENQPFIFDHVYNCEGYTSVCSVAEREKTYAQIKEYERTKNLNAVDFSGTCLCNGNTKDSNCWNLQENACQFKPRVMVKDNWGWCTGSCTTNDLWYLGGCYDNYKNPTNGTTTNQCDSTDLDVFDKKHWVKFSGRILLQPK